MKKIQCTVLLAFTATILSACTDRMVASKDGTEANKLLLLASAAKTQPLAPDASRELEKRLVDEYLKGTTPEEAHYVRELLAPSHGAPSAVSIEPAADAPDTPEVKEKWALLSAFMDLRKERFAAEYRAKNPPRDMTGRTSVQVLFVKELQDTTADAMIYLRMRDKETPYLVVRDHNLTAQELYRHVMNAVRTLHAIGGALTADQVIAVHNDSIADIPESKVGAGYQEILDHYEKFMPADIEGIGKGKTIGVLARNPPSVNDTPARKE